MHPVSRLQTRNRWRARPSPTTSNMITWCIRARRTPFSSANTVDCRTRSLPFENETFAKQAPVAREPISKKNGFWQPAMQVNYPNDYDFTGNVEIKHATGQACESAPIVKAVCGGAPRHLPRMSIIRYLTSRRGTCTAAIPRLVDGRVSNVRSVGRLGTYRYYNMYQVVADGVGRIRQAGSKVV